MTALALGLSGLGSAAYALIEVSDNNVVVPVEVSDNNVLSGFELLTFEDMLNDLSVEDVDVDVLEDIIEDSELLNDLSIEDVDVLEDIIEDSDIDVLEDIVEDSELLNDVEVEAIVAALLELL
jgi:hypothetical protein